MAKLVKCKDCGHEVSKSAKACPNCGAKLPGRHPILITLLALIIIGVFGSLIGTISETDTGPVSTGSSAVAQPKLELLEGWKVTRGEYGNVKITGKVRNNSSKEYGYAQISFNLYDRENAQIGTALANVSNLEANGVWKFEAMCLEDNVATAKFKDVTGF